MATRDDDGATVTFAARELKLPTMDWSVEDVHKVFILFKAFAKMWIETKGIQNHKQYMSMLQLLGMEVLCHWESFPLAAPSNNKEQPDHI